MIECILLAKDGSVWAERAADFAASLATRYQAQVMVLHVYSPIPNYWGEPQYRQALDKALTEARTLVAGVVKRLQEAEL